MFFSKKRLAFEQKLQRQKQLLESSVWYARDVLHNLPDHLPIPQTHQNLGVEVATFLPFLYDAAQKVVPLEVDPIKENIRPYLNQSEVCIPMLERIDAMVERCEDEELARLWDQGSIASISKIVREIIYRPLWPEDGRPRALVVHDGIKVPKR